MTEFEMKLKQVTQAVSRGKLSRRDFMSYAMSIGITAGAANTMFATAARAEPKKGGIFKAALGEGSTTDSLEPATWTNGFTAQFGKSVTGAALAQVGPKNDLIMHVAESFEPSDGAKKWVINIRKGITFHNGKTLTSDDVVATINYHIGPDTKSAAKEYFPGVTSVKTDGPDKVVIELSSGNVDLPYAFAGPTLAIFPSSDGKIEWEKGIGAGPYILKSFEPGVKFIGERNPNYFADTWFDGIEIIAISDVTARTNAYLSGELHFAHRVDLKTIDMLKNAPNTEIYNVSGPTPYTAPMLCDAAPFDNPAVRKALKYSINRQELVDKVLYGYGKVGNDNPIGSSYKYAIDPQPQHTYDPEKAKAILKEAGIENLKVDLSCPPNAAFAGALDAALLMKESAKAAGIEINVIREPDDGYWSNVWLKKPWSMCYWGSRPTVDLMLSVSLAADAAWNDTHFKNARFNELLVQARGELDEAKRAAMYAECQQIVHDDGGQVVLMFYNFVNALSTAVAHGELNSDLDMDGGYMAERWWMA